MTESGTNGVRRTVFFSGNVQGVGFRYTTEAVATRFQVTGFVRNLADGRVELVAEGAPGEVGRFQHAVEEALRHCIHQIDPTESPATGKFTSFGIAM